MTWWALAVHQNSKIDEPERRCACGAFCRREVHETDEENFVVFGVAVIFGSGWFCAGKQTGRELKLDGLNSPPRAGKHGATGWNHWRLRRIGELSIHAYARSALELNYQYQQDIQKYVTSFNSIRVHTRMQEISGAYVYNFTFRNFNPFAEAGIGGYIFGPIKDQKTTDLDAKQSTNVGFLYGAGIAYELSPSWDIRAEYRGIVMKAPNFGLEQYRTNRYFNLNNPTIGIAYHF